MVEVDPWVVIGTIATIIGLGISLIAIWHNNKTLRDGLRNVSELVELEHRKNERENYRLQLEKKEHEARENWRKFTAGLKLIDLLTRNDEVIEEYEEEEE